MKLSPSQDVEAFLQSSLVFGLRDPASLRDLRHRRPGEVIPPVCAWIPDREERRRATLARLAFVQEVCGGKSGRVEERHEPESTEIALWEPMRVAPQLLQQ